MYKSPVHQIKQLLHVRAGLSGQYQVVYVEADNTVYAINAVNGQILLQRNFGTLGTLRGIKSTPVINPATGTMYVIPYTSVRITVKRVTLHSISVGTLTGRRHGLYHVTASNTFQYTDRRHDRIASIVHATCIRSALLLLGGNIYAGFRGNEHFVGTETHSRVGHREVGFGMERVHSCSADAAING